MPAGTSARLILPRWWRMQVVATVPHVDVIDRVRDDAGWSGRYAFMTVMSAGIAVLGLLQSSPAVVIGAMLISPLMGPIIGLGFALATFDLAALRRASIALALGTLIAICFTALVVLVSPLQNVTAEIAARTRPNLFDLMIALFSALAGAYATIRDRAGAVVGVAIATALMPPLAVIGFGLATLNWNVFSGAALLFFTNLMTIALAAAVVARLFGFGPRLSPHQTVLQSVVLVLLFAGLAVPLGFALHRVGREALASREARTLLAGEFGDGTRIGQVEINYDAHPVQVAATVFTPAYRSGAQQHLNAAMQQAIGEPVRLTLEQVRVARGEADANAAQQAQASAAQAEAARADAAVAERLALAAGVAPDAVVLDTQHRRARMRAAPLPGATIGTYRALEARVAAASPGWEVWLIPPPAAIGSIAVKSETLDEAAQTTIADAAWGAERLHLAVVVAGSGAIAKQAATALTKAGATVIPTAGSRHSAVALEWHVMPTGDGA